MKLLVEKLPLAEDTSFVANIHTTPLFEVPWHQHVEYELILFLKGEGHSYIGNHVGSFSPGDVYFLGSNLPHTFQKSSPELITSAVVIHFKEDFWGKQFLDLPECKDVVQLLQLSEKGLSVQGNLKEKLSTHIQSLVRSKGFQRVVELCECLLEMVKRPDFNLLSTQEIGTGKNKNKEKIDKVFQYSIENFQEPITLKAISAHVGMSIPAFCSYFKRCTKKTYIDFLNEIRIGFACKQLSDSQRTIESICYESGYNTLANFNKQFFKVKRTSPSRFRKTLTKNIIDKRE